VVDSLLRIHHTATDPVAATAALRAVLGSAEVDTAGALSWEQVSLVDDGISIVSLRAAGDHLRAVVRRSPELVVLLVRDGAVRFRDGEHRLTLGPDDLALLPIGATGQLDWDRAHIELFSFPPAPLARLLGVPRTAVRLHAPRPDPRSPALAEYFRRVAHLLTSGVFGVPEVYARDLIRVHTIDALTAVTVDAFELTNRSEDRSDRDAAILRRAIGELRAHLGEPISIPEIAHAAGVSVRGLQMVFQRQLGVSPLLHLRQLRLEAARDALIQEAQTGTTIADVARRFGYSNSGRFSTHYRDEYGESPAASLSRVRSAGSDDAPAAPAEGPGEAEVVRPAAR
jgi:AraC-like DNA-binding protein